MASRAPVLVGLYLPGDRPERFAKALAAGADQVILDLEDAVAPGRKQYARDAVAELLGSPGVEVAVRPNGPRTPWHSDDLEMLAGVASPPALRLPKVESTDDVDQVLFRTSADVAVTCLIESALGLEQAFLIASHPAVTAVALGEADLQAELGITAEAGLDGLRVRLVVAARAAGLNPPNMAVYPKLGDDDGLLASCRHGAALGMLGRTAIHPRQIPVIRDAFRPSAQDVQRAQEVLSTLTGDVGAARLPDGRMVDEAMAAGARRTLQIRDLLSGP